MRMTTILFLMLINILINQSCIGGKKTEIMVLGTIHQFHDSNPNYSYYDICNLLEAYQPDLICVEIRSEDFGMKPYLKEMMLATVYGKEKGIEVAPIDWWTEKIQMEAMEVMQTANYKRNEILLDSILSTNPIIRQFENTHGKYQEMITRQVSIDIINDTMFNSFIRERNRIVLDLMGDGPATMYMQTRNERMVELIQIEIKKHKANRVIILTGGEHKHFFDQHLASVEGNEIISPLDLNISSNSNYSSLITNLIEKNEYESYYSDEYLNNPKKFFSDKLVPLLHGPNMDFEPHSIPAANIAQAGRILNNWSKKDSTSMVYKSELAWYCFLTGNYEDAISRYKEIDSECDVPSHENPLISIMLYRNIGLCYDLLGQREAAIRSYQKGKSNMKGIRAKLIKNYLFKDYEEIPYQGK